MRTYLAVGDLLHRRRVWLLGVALMGLMHGRTDRKPSIQTDPYPFIENLGQLADPEGRPLSEAYFTFESPGLQGYVTKWGLTLFFYRIEQHTLEEGEEELESTAQMKRELSEVKWERVDVELVGACVDGERIRKGLGSPWGRNYYLGHCPQGVLGVRGYGEVRIEGVWPGVDWVLRYDERMGGVKQEFVVQGGYRWDVVRLRIWSKGRVEVSGGRLRVMTAYGEFVEEGLVGYYGSERVGVSYRVLSERRAGEVYATEVGYEVGGVPEIAGRTLVIDPVLQWGTYFGGGGEEYAYSVAVDGSGNVFIVGYTNSSTGFPLQDPPGTNDYFDGSYNGGNYDAFIAKFSGSTLGLLWSTYFGAGGWDEARSVAVDGSGNIFVVGYTNSNTGFPLQDLPGTNDYFDGTFNGVYDAFIAKFSGSTLGLLWSTYFGGAGEDVANSVVVDGSGDVFVAGFTGSSTGFPLQDPPGTNDYFVGSYNGGNYDAFIAKFSGSTLGLLWSTYFGGGKWDQARSVAVDGSGNIFVVGYTNSNTGFPLQDPPGTNDYYDGTFNGIYDAFIAKFSGSTLGLLWSTYFGGGGDDYASSVAADGSGNVFMVGATFSASNFPLANPGGGAYYDNTHNGSYDVFIAKFSGATLGLVWSTYFGGSARDYPLSDRAAVARDGFLAVAGASYSTDGIVNIPRFPFCVGSFQQGSHGGVEDLLILTFDLDGVIRWRTFYGASGHEETPASVAVYSPYLYVVGNSPGPLPPATYLPNPGGGAYHDNTYNGDPYDAVLLRFNYADCPLFYGDSENHEGDGKSNVGVSWRAWWDGEGVRVAGVETPGWYSVLSVDGRVVGRWYISSSEGRLEGAWRPGLYVVFEERSGESRRLVVGP